MISSCDEVLISMVLEEREWTLVDLPEMLEKAFSVSEHPIVGYLDLIDTYSTSRPPNPPGQMYKSRQKLLKGSTWLGVDVDFDFNPEPRPEHELVIATITVFISSIRIPYTSFPRMTRQNGLIGKVSLHWDKSDLNRIPHDIVHTSFGIISGYFGKGGPGGEGREKEPDPWEPEPSESNPVEPVYVPVGPWPKEAVGEEKNQNKLEEYRKGCRSVVSQREIKMSEKNIERAVDQLLGEGIGDDFGDDYDRWEVWRDRDSVEYVDDADMVATPTDVRELKGDRVSQAIRLGELETGGRAEIAPVFLVKTDNPDSSGLLILDLDGGGGDFIKGILTRSQANKAIAGSPFEGWFSREPYRE